MTFKAKIGLTAALSAAMLLLGCGNKEQSGSSTQASTAQKPAAQASAASFSPYVDEKGNITRPVSFLNDPNWVHMGAWGVVNENGEGNGMHNVYTTYDVVKAYRQSGKFPDGAVLVKEVRGASSANLTTGRAHWAADKAVWFVSVKDTTNRFPDNPLWGDGWGWALFEAGAPAKQVATDYKTDCLGCHVPAKETDWMYVQAYPVLKE